MYIYTTYNEMRENPELLFRECLALVSEDMGW